MAFYNSIHLLHDVQYIRIAVYLSFEKIVQVKLASLKSIRSRIKCPILSVHMPTHGPGDKCKLRSSQSKKSLNCVAYLVLL